jgi:chromosome segregation ATPase
MKKLVFLLTLLTGSIFAGNGLMAQSLTDAKNSIDADLEASIDAYAELQAFIREEKVPLSKRLNEVEREARDKERELNRMLRLRDASERGLLEINEDIESIEENIQYMENLLNDFTRRFEASINIAEKQLYQEPIDTVKGFTEVSDTGEEVSAAVRSSMPKSEVVSAALERDRGRDRGPHLHR